MCFFVNTNQLQDIEEMARRSPRAQDCGAFSSRMPNTLRSTKRQPQRFGGCRHNRTNQ